MNFQILFFLITCLYSFNSLNSTNSTDSQQEVQSDEYANTHNKSIFTPEILNEYAEYKVLEEYNPTCNFESQIVTFSEKDMLNKIKSTKCIPDNKSLVAILEAGWTSVAEYLIKDVYLKQHIDPSSTLNIYLMKNEGQMKKMKSMLDTLPTSEPLKLVYSFEDFENIVKFNAKLPDSTYIPEYISLFCYKDMFKVFAIFKSKNKFYSVRDSKKFSSTIEDDCYHNYNSFSNQIEISINKAQKLKKWDRLFK